MVRRGDAQSDSTKERATYTARITIAGCDLSFRTSCRNAFDYLKGLDHLTGIRPYDFCTSADTGSLPTLEYVDESQYRTEFNPVTQTMTVSFPWIEEVPELFDLGEPFHNMLLYPLRVLLELIRQEACEYVFHASAVIREGRAILLAGGPESGKTTTALDLCRNHGFALFANDQVLLGLRRGVPWILQGEDRVNIRFSSVAKYSPPLAKYLFRSTDGNEEPWNLKREVSPKELGISTATSPAPLSVFVKIRLDDSVDDCVVSLLSSWSDGAFVPIRERERFFTKIELYRSITETIRSASFTPLRETDLTLMNVFAPDLDRPQFAAKRVRFLNTLFDDRRMAFLSIRGPLEKCVDAILAAVEMTRNGFA
jgi:hypothetical protein